MRNKDSSVVYLESVSKIYPTAQGEVYAVYNVTLDVQPGEFYSLLGSSGSGKTTMLRLIGGFDIPEYGQVFIDGEEVTTLPPYRRNVHTVFQSYALFPHLTVAENVAYPLAIAGVSRSDIAQQVQESLQRFQILQLGERRPAQLSGGQQQRVALARALINRPKVLLLDEPLSALDAKIREEVRQELRKLQRQTNLTFIYVTHDQEEALALSDRLAVMHNGQVQQCGTPKEIYNRPDSLFVASFIGKANFLRGTVVAATKDICVVDVNRVRIKAISPSKLPTISESVTLMIRPERLRVNCAAVADNQVTGKTASVMYMGHLLQLHIETALGKLTVTQLSDGNSCHEGQTLSWDAQDCILVKDTDCVARNSSK